MKEERMLSKSLEIIKKAMDERRSISAYYDRFFRKLSPYELGTKKGKYIYTIFHLKHFYL